MGCCSFATSSSKQLVVAAGRSACWLPPRPRSVVVLSGDFGHSGTLGKLPFEDGFFLKKFTHMERRGMHHFLDNPFQRCADRVLFAMTCGLHTSFAYRAKVPRIRASIPARSVAAVHPTEIISERCILRNMTYMELEEWVGNMGFKKSQALMLWRFLYESGKWATTVDEMSGLSRAFKDFLKDAAELTVLKAGKVYPAADGTHKILFTVDGGTVETVVIPCSSGRGRTTVCVSSQVGCAMNCQFCFTGRMGLKRNLSTAEIIEQLVVANRLFVDKVGPITNVVFMGMGEPLHNADSVIRAANIMIDERGLHLSHNKVTISTSGLVPQIRQFYQQTTCSLAVSLNATTDEVRNWIMPINRKYNLGVLMRTLKEEIFSRSSRPVFFEYVMLAGVNDSAEDAHRLVKLVEDIPCKINLICFNAHSESTFRRSPDDQMFLFRNILTKAGLVVHFRQSRGDDQMAACGQLGTLGEQRAPRMSVPDQFRSALAA